MLDFMREKGVVLVAVACNTISTVIDKFSAQYGFPLFSIIEPAAKYAAASALQHIGLLATEFTVKTGHYQKLIRERNASITVHAKGSKTLAALIEAPDYDEAAVDEELSSLLSALRGEYPVNDIILGCTHYPIAMKLFRKRAPDIHFIDPAALQAREIKSYLESHGYDSHHDSGSLNVYTRAAPRVSSGFGGSCTSRCSARSTPARCSPRRAKVRGLLPRGAQRYDWAVFKISAKTPPAVTAAPAPGPLTTKGLLE